MYICLCKAVSDHDIEAAVLAGANSLAEIQQSLGVSTGCGRCESAAQLVITQATAKRYRSETGESGLQIGQLDANTVAALVYAA